MSNVEDNNKSIDHPPRENEELTVVNGKDEIVLQQAVTNDETRKHIAEVANYIRIIVNELLKRSIRHDATKLETPEVEEFTNVQSKLAELEYDSEEYNANLKQLEPALEHHYAKNRHHPQHYPNGIRDMNIVDIVEMFCDWKASSSRNRAGNILMSINKNSEKFDAGEQLSEIFKNTATFFEHVE